MNIELHLGVWWEWDVDYIEDKRGQLEVLENANFV